MLADLHGLVNADGPRHAGIFRAGVGGHNAERRIADLGGVLVRSAVVAVHREFALRPESVDRNIAAALQRGVAALGLGYGQQII